MSCKQCNESDITELDENINNDDYFGLFTLDVHKKLISTL